METGEDSSIGPGEEMTKEALGYREKNRGVWSHTDLVGIPFWSLGYVTLGSDLASLKLSFLIYERGYDNKVSEHEIYDSLSSTSLAQGPV